MAINSITNSVAAQQASTYTAAKTDHTEKKSESSTKTDTGVVYEKSSGQTSGTVTKKTDYALVNKLKADAEAAYLPASQSCRKDDDQAGCCHRYRRFYVELPCKR